MATIKKISLQKSSTKENAHPLDFNFQEQQLCLEGLPESIAGQKRSAWQTYLSLPLPSMREEGWKRLDLRDFNAAEYAKLGLKDGFIRTSTGIFQEKSMSEVAAQEIVFCDWKTAELHHADLLERIADELLKPEEGKLIALTQAFAESGFLLYVPRGAILTAPLHALVEISGQHQAYFSRIVIWLEAESRVELFLQETSPKENKSDLLFSNLLDIHVGEGAALKLYSLQELDLGVWAYANQRAKVQRDGNLEWFVGMTGSRLTKCSTTVDLEGKGSVGKYGAFFLTDHQQQIDYETRQNHLASQTTSDLLFKGALREASRSVWRGMVYVAPGASKTDGYQANHNLLLSHDAHADSLPGLEILNDDVRCSHGATVGRLDQDSLFYLLSRGIPRDQAEELLVSGFFDPIIRKISSPDIQDVFRNALLEKMGCLDIQADI